MVESIIVIGDTKILIKKLLMISLIRMISTPGSTLFEKLNSTILHMCIGNENCGKLMLLNFQIH